MKIHFNLHFCSSVIVPTTSKYKTHCVSMNFWRDGRISRLKKKIRQYEIYVKMFVHIFLQVVHRYHTALITKFYWVQLKERCLYLKIHSTNYFHAKILVGNLNKGVCVVGGEFSKIH